MDKQRPYETVIVLDPSLDEAGIEKEIEKVTSFLAARAGQVASAERWGRRKMAYPIKNRHDGTYLCIQFHSPASVPLELNRMIMLNDNVLRHLIVQGHSRSMLAPPPELPRTEALPPVPADEVKPQAEAVPSPTITNPS